MITGRSSLHVNQTEGQAYSKVSVEGYYNNLTEKVSRFGLPGNEIPKVFVDTGEQLYFSIAIFQYGLAAYDLYLINKDEQMLGKVKACADWAVENQDENGGWSTFAYQNTKNPYSSMAQGEGISLLVRANKVFGDDKYLKAARMAKQFMLTSLDEGGVAKYEDGKIYLYEFPTEPLVLNGFIFSSWGLFDYAKAFHDDETMALWKQVADTIADCLPTFDTGFWSMYNNVNKIASPFYHALHIAQLNVMYDLTGDERFRDYAQRWDKNRKNWFNGKRAFITKAIQKIKE